MSFNKKSNEFDVKINFVVRYSKYFKEEYSFDDKKSTIEGENPGLLNQIKGHEEGHVDQLFEQANTAISVKFEFMGIKNTYKGKVDQVLTKIFKAYKTAGKVKDIDEFNTRVLPWAESAVMTKLAEETSKPYPDAEADANHRGEQSTGKPKYGVVDDKNNTNIKFKGKTLKATENE